ncbi:macrophage mannose receptor 1 [Hyalella azteca]|uniref:Macrophage mannose receptor 1 n=1 Tax=Hyalella azteca TaxID=294128 RepID=A0A8B7N311_HYAAZ|nr:macrophage mannose receptor 1 [Hyalella azteca]
MRVVVTLTMCLLGLGQEGQCRYKEWKPVSADPAVLKGQNSSRILGSRTRCSSWASTKDWTFMACYIPLTGLSGNCTLWDDKPIRNGQVNLTASTGSSNCMAVFGADACVLPGNTLLKVGEKRANQFCSNDLQDVCLPSGMMDVNKPTAPLQSCTAPFSVSGGSCLMVSSVTKNWCEARAICLSLGADLVTARSDQDLMQIQTFYKASGMTQYVWVGSNKINGQWVWLNSYRNPYTMPDWYPGQPDSDLCGHIVKTAAGDVRLADLGCSGSLLFMCGALLAP